MDVKEIGCEVVDWMQVTLWLDSVVVAREIAYKYTTLHKITEFYTSSWAFVPS
jgi:hypothetical protein